MNQNTVVPMTIEEFNMNYKNGQLIERISTGERAFFVATVFKNTTTGGGAVQVRISSETIGGKYVFAYWNTCDTRKVEAVRALDACNICGNPMSVITAGADPHKGLSYDVCICEMCYNVLTSVHMKKP